MSAIRCPRCEKEISTPSRFCRRCGWALPLRAAVVPPPVLPVAAPPIVPPPPPRIGAPPPPLVRAKAVRPTPPPAKRKSGGGGGVVVVLGLIGAVSFFTFQSRQANSVATPKPMRNLPTFNRPGNLRITLPETNLPEVPLPDLPDLPDRYEVQAERDNDIGPRVTVRPVSPGARTGVPGSRHVESPWWINPNRGSSPSSTDSSHRR